MIAIIFMVLYFFFSVCVLSLSFSLSLFSFVSGRDKEDFRKRTRITMTTIFGKYRQIARCQIVSTSCNKLFYGNVRLKYFIQNDQKRAWISIIIVQKATEFIFELKCEDKRKGDPVFGQTEKWILFYYSNVIRNRKFRWNSEFGNFFTNPMFGFFILRCFAIIQIK